MTIPDFQTIMLPLLKFLGDGKERSIHEIVEQLAKDFKLSIQELGEMLPSSTQTVFYNRVGWARTYLSKAGLLDGLRKYYQISDQGKEVLKKNPARIDIAFLKQFPKFMEFREGKPKPIPSIIGPGPTPVVPTPEETLEDAYQEIREKLIQDLLDNVKNCQPAFFERLVVELLVNMGYGGSRKEAARAVGKVGDGGIDGIIDEDRLGLDAVYIQAKRWDNVVGRPEVQKFVGALMGKRAKKGIFITNSSFSLEAIAFVSSIDYRIVLIDGKRLAEFMVDYDIGVTEVSTYKLKRIDSDYFSND